VLNLKPNNWYFQIVIYTNNFYVTIF
jgi:hypothetical protein